MLRTSRVLFTAAAVWLGLLLAPPAADAGKKRIAVLEIEGARSATLHKEVAKIVGKQHSVLSPSAFQKARRKTKTRKLNTAGVKKVARYLELDGVVEGMVVAEDGGYVLRLRLREGVSGKTVRKFTVFLESPKLTAKVRRQLSERIHKAIGDLEPVLADEPNFDKDAFRDDDADDDEPRRARKATRKNTRKAKRRDSKRRARADRSSKRARDLIGDRDIEALSDDDDDDGDRRRSRRSSRRDDDRDDFDDDFDDRDEDDGDRRRSRRASRRDDDRDEDDDGDRRDRRRRGDDDFDDDDGDFGDDDDRRAARRGGPSARTAGMAVHAGVAVVGRSLAFTYRADLATPPSQYTGAFAPGAYLTGDFYPLAISSKADSIGANIGFGFDVERAIGLSSQVTGPAVMEPVALATQRQRYGVRAQYRHNFGTKDTHPSAIVSVGYNKLAFTIDRSAAPEGIVIDVPDVDYTFLDPGVTLRLPLGRKLTLSATGKFMAILDAGAIATPTQYGQAMVTGFDADAAFELRPAGRWLLRLGAHVTAIGYTFQEAAGELSSNRDGDLASLDVGGALDRYLGGYVTAGYMY